MASKYSFSQPAESSRTDSSNQQMLPSQPIVALQKCDFSQDKTTCGSNARIGGNHYDQKVNASGSSSVTLNTHHHHPSTSEDFKRRLKAFIDDELSYHVHDSIQLHDNLPTLKIDANVAKNRRKDTSKTENGIKLSSKIEESAASTSKGSAWNKWLSSETPSLIAVVGQSCAGKSNLAKMILRSPFMRTFQYRFYISLKGNSKNEMNLLEFLTQKKLALNWIENPSLDKTTDEIYQKVIDKLRCEKVCIVFDDIGIGSFAFDKDEIEPSYFRKQFANQFFSSILNKELLCKAKVVMVLNHWEYEHVILQLQPEAYKLIHVFGIDQDDQIRMAESSLCQDETCCAYNETKKNVAILDVEVHSEYHDADKCVLCDNHDLCDCADEIQLLLNVPIHCRSFLEHCSSCTKGCRIANACYLLLKWLQYIVIIYPKTSYCLNEVGKFAWNKYIQDTFLFTFEDLKSLSKTERNIFFVSLCNIQVTEKDLLYRFSSILLQDFLAAVWCLSLSNDEMEYNKQKFKQWNNSALVIAFMKEISQMHQQFRLGPSLNVNHENVLKVEKYCPKSKTNSNPTSISEYVRRLKSNFNFF